MKKSKLWLAASLLLCSCAMDEPTVTEQPEGSERDPNFIELSEALQNAEQEFKAVYGSSTRGKRSVSDTELFLPKSYTRSDTEEELYGFYIVNYDDGFAMLSADRRRPAVYALSDEGSLHLSDTIENKGLSWYINECAGIIPGGPGNQPADSVIKPFNPPKPYTKETVIVSKPLLKGILSTFHQHSPYNIYCPQIDGQNCPVGCVPLAIGTVMAYYKWPAKYENYTFSWDNMLANSSNTLWARLFEIIGRPFNVTANYGLETTSAPVSNITRAMKNMGYQNTICSYYQNSIIEQELEGNHPILCHGYRTDPETNKRVGHMWVIDGGYYTKETNQIGFGNDYYYKYYYHCVWGWGVKANGYFLIDTYYVEVGGTPVERDPYSYGESPTYKDLGIVYGYRPIK